jgi:hypothetical protein
MPRSGGGLQMAELALSRCGSRESFTRSALVESGDSIAALHNDWCEDWLMNEGNGVGGTNR